LGLGTWDQGLGISRATVRLTAFAKATAGQEAGHSVRSVSDSAEGERESSDVCSTKQNIDRVNAEQPKAARYRSWGWGPTTSKKGGCSARERAEIIKKRGSDEA
jgi:hypothetical protein